MTWLGIESKDLVSVLDKLLADVPPVVDFDTARLAIDLIVRVVDPQPAPSVTDHNCLVVVDVVCVTMDARLGIQANAIFLWPLSHELVDVAKGVLEVVGVTTP